MKPSRILFASSGLWLGLLLTPAIPAFAVPGDEHWDVQFGWPGTLNMVAAIVLYDGRLCTGGFGSGVTTNTTLMVWDGSQWSGFGQFLGDSPYVGDLACFGGALYAGGTFTNVDGVAAAGLVRWNGHAWSGVGGFTGTVSRLAVEGGNLYVGGNFTNAGGVAVTNVGYWDGSAWHALGNGLGKNTDSVYALVASNGVVYAGGDFTNSGSVALTHLARWNGSSWAPVGGGVNNTVQALALKGTDLYAGGDFTQAGSTSANYIARWDGTNWSALGTGLGWRLRDVTRFGDLICATGSFTNAGGVAAHRFALWNGSFWSAAGSGLSGGDGLRLLSAGTNVYVGGYFLLAGDMLTAGIVSWDGARWSRFGSAGRTNGLSFAPRAIAGDGTNVYVGGGFGWAGNMPANGIARWDGAAWHALGSGMIGTNSASTSVRALALSGTNLYAGGIFTNAGGVSASNIARWDGNQWHALGGGIPGTVAAIAVRSNDVFVGGTFTLPASDGTALNIARWDGNSWRILPGSGFGGPLYNSFVNAIAIQGNDVYVGGSLFATNSALLKSTNITRWDGADWQPLAGGVNSNVNAITIVGTNVYVAGKFTVAGGLAVNCIARWTGVAWSDMGGGVTGSSGPTPSINPSVSALAVMDDDLYVGGNFIAAGGLDAQRIAKWNGTNWSALGSGVVYPGLSSGTVMSLAALGSDLYVGGTFLLAGNKASCYFGRWNETRNFDPAPRIQLGKARWAAPDPFKFQVVAPGVPGYVIEATTNFSGWIPLETNSVSFYEFWDADALNRPCRFYRVRCSP